MDRRFVTEMALGGMSSFTTGFTQKSILTGIFMATFVISTFLPIGVPLKSIEMSIRKINTRVSFNVIVLMGM